MRRAGGQPQARFGRGLGDWLGSGSTFFLEFDLGISMGLLIFSNIRTAFGRQTLGGEYIPRGRGIP